ncbi:hypothetical protein PAPYR_1789 [Paratrimastix pyriformis]|uniref:Calponin-homology (CH) domain-containing protein n=1 Tax=Paratrimastix pyriformis TaxID=342808 RepID=A0ABQ8URA5_9EUKA|nr:hypothetical protein PAPYR_1789 [Paratrimastix pyriformis]
MSSITLSRNNRNAELYLARSRVLLRWMRDVLGDEGDGQKNFATVIQNGVLLCRVVQKLFNANKPADQQANFPFRAEISGNPAQQTQYSRDNVASCLKFAREHGVPGDFLCVPDDVVDAERRNPIAVMGCLFAIARIAQNQWGWTGLLPPASRDPILADLFKISANLKKLVADMGAIDFNPPEDISAEGLVACKDCVLLQSKVDVLTKKLAEVEAERDQLRAKMAALAAPEAPAAATL